MKFWNSGGCSTSSLYKSMFKSPIRISIKVRNAIITMNYVLFLMTPWASYMGASIVYMECPELEIHLHHKLVNSTLGAISAHNRVSKLQTWCHFLHAEARINHKHWPVSLYKGWAQQKTYPWRDTLISGPTLYSSDDVDLLSCDTIFRGVYRGINVPGAYAPGISPFN